MTWGNQQLFSTQSKPRVRKTVGAWQPWTVTNHVFGPRRFYTWQEAMDYANVQTYYTINGAKV